MFIVNEWSKTFLLNRLLEIKLQCGLFSMGENRWFRKKTNELGTFLFVVDICGTMHMYLSSHDLKLMTLTNLWSSWSDKLSCSLLCSSKVNSELRSVLWKVQKHSRALSLWYELKLDIHQISVCYGVWKIPKFRFKNMWFGPC